MPALDEYQFWRSRLTQRFPSLEGLEPDLFHMNGAPPTGSAALWDEFTLQPATYVHANSPEFYLENPTLALVLLRRLFVTQFTALLTQADDWGINAWL